MPKDVNEYQFIQTTKERHVAAKTLRELCKENDIKYAEQFYEMLVYDVLSDYSITCIEEAANILADLIEPTSCQNLDKDSGFYCSYCGEEHETGKQFKFCPSCGAKVAS